MRQRYYRIFPIIWKWGPRSGNVGCRLQLAGSLVFHSGQNLGVADPRHYPQPWRFTSEDWFTLFVGDVTNSQFSAETDDVDQFVEELDEEFEEFQILQLFL